VDLGIQGTEIMASYAALAMMMMIAVAEDVDIINIRENTAVMIMKAATIVVQVTAVIIAMVIAVIIAANVVAIVVSVAVAAAAAVAMVMAMEEITSYS